MAQEGFAPVGAQLSVVVEPLGRVSVAACTSMADRTGTVSVVVRTTGDRTSLVTRNLVVGDRMKAMGTMVLDRKQEVVGVHKKLVSKGFSGGRQLPLVRVDRLDQPKQYAEF